MLQKKLKDNNIELPYAFLPRSYKRIGHVVILNLNSKLIDYKFVIAKTLLSLLYPQSKTVARFIEPIKGRKRKPSIEWLAGDTNLITKHSELNTTFIVDTQELMFSAGNHFERKRLVEIVKDCKIKFPVILDMFACIGNLSLPIAKNNASTSVFAIDINTKATKYLKKNLILNNISESRYQVIIGDNRTICPQNIADFVIMGFFGIDNTQLSVGLNGLKKETGGFMFIHDIFEREKESTVIKNFKLIIDNTLHLKLESIKKRIIKSINPSLIHVVFDCEIRLAN